MPSKLPRLLFRPWFCHSLWPAGRGADASRYELEDRGLTTRRRDPADRRRHIVEISKDGETELDAADARIAAVDDEVLHALSPEERAAFHQLLVRAVSAEGPPCDDRHGEV